MKGSHKKVKGIEYNQLVIQDYLTSSLFNDKERKACLQLRTKMDTAFKANFKTHFEGNINCQLKCDKQHIDTQENILMCPSIKRHINTDDISYALLFKEPWEQLRALRKYINIIELKEKLEESIKSERLNLMNPNIVS